MLEAIHASTKGTVLCRGPSFLYMLLRKWEIGAVDD